MAHEERGLSLYRYDDYKTYLKQMAQSRPRGFRKELAHFIPCQTAYLSHVLNGSGHFNLEQAEAIARFLELDPSSTRYLLVLVEYGRAGSHRLKKILAEQLSELRERNLQIKERVGIQNTLTQQDQMTYYSSWHYAAVHMAVTIPRLRTRSALARALRISPRKLAEVLGFLVSVGLLTVEGETFGAGSTLLHLSKESPLIHQHHSNWRAQALAAQHEEGGGEGVHYSVVVSLSYADAERLRETITQHIGETIDVVKQSKEEILHGFNIDFYRLDREDP